MVRVLSYLGIALLIFFASMGAAFLLFDAGEEVEREIAQDRAGLKAYYIANELETFDDRIFFDCAEPGAVHIAVVDDRDRADAVGYQVTERVDADFAVCIEEH